MTAGAFFAVTLVAAFGLDVPVVGLGLVIFMGGLAAGGSSWCSPGAGRPRPPSHPRRLGHRDGPELGHGTLLLLFETETTGLFAWGTAPSTNLDLDGLRQAG